MEVKLIEFDEVLLAATTKWLQDKELRKLIDAPILNFEKQRIWFDGLVLRQDYKIWGLNYDSTNIGVCGLKNIEKTSAEYFGYIGVKTLWGKELGQQIIKLAISKAKELKLDEVYLFVLTDNLRAIKSYKKFGFIKDSIIEGKLKMIISLDDL